LLKNVNALERNSQILNFMGCNGTNHQMIQCAKSIDPKIALDKADEYFYSHANHGVAQFTFLPVVDNYFLEEEPINLLNRGKFKKCPILTGANKDEGNWLFVYAFPEYRNFSTRPDFDYETFKDFLTSLYHFYPQFPSTSSKSVMQAIQYRYTNWENVDNSIKNFENFDEAAGDFHFLCPTVDFASTYALNDQDVFLYYFTQRSSIHMWPEWMGVMHGDEISFVFGEPLNPSKNYTEEEKVLTRKILKYWSNFARYDDPNKNLNSLSKTKTLSQYIEPWPKFKVIKNSTYDQHRAYLNLNSKEISIGYNLRAEYCAFWGSFLPNLVLNECKKFSFLK
jgi:acetylcholinesterase